MKQNLQRTSISDNELTVQTKSNYITLLPTTVIVLQNGYHFDVSKVITDFRKLNLRQKFNTLHPVKTYDSMVDSTLLT